MTLITERKRTLASAITYRVVSTLLLMVITYLISGVLFDSLVITLTFAILATIVYYFNERAWERSGWGRRTTP